MCEEMQCWQFIQFTGSWCIFYFNYCHCEIIENNFNRNFDFLIPDAPELIANFLEGEQDMSCKRNAFMMLIHADQVHKIY